MIWRWKEKTGHQYVAMTMPVHCPASALLFSVSIQVIYQLIRRKHTIENERKCKKKKDGGNEEHPQALSNPAIDCRHC